MVFRSFYSRVIFILISVTLLLFVALALANVYAFRYALTRVMTEIQEERFMRLFRHLERDLGRNPRAGEVSAYLDSVYFEIDVDVFDRAGLWLGGNNADRRPVNNHTRLRPESPLTGFRAVYRNPNPDSPYAAIRVRFYRPDAPVLRFLLFTFLLSCVVIVIVSVAVGWKLVSYVNTRLDRLRRGVSQVSQGDFDVHVEVDGQDEIAFLARSFNDMSAHIKKLVGRLEESNAARQRLFAHASHEIKSPLTSIKGFIDIVEYMNLLPPEQQKSLLPAVKKDIQRVIKITHDMLELTRLQEPEYQLQMQPVDLRRFLWEEHTFFAKKAAEQNARARLVCRPQRTVTLESDPDRLAQILNNLWSNGLKYGDLSNPIETELWTGDGKAWIAIRNHLKAELGVPTERLFEPFYRNPADADKVTGSGLGLAIVKELTEKLGGEVCGRVEAHRLVIELCFPVTDRSFLKQLSRRQRRKSRRAGRGRGYS